LALLLPDNTLCAPTLIGGAKIAGNSTQGQTNTVGLRFTIGTEFLPNYVEGMSYNGMMRTNRWGNWNWYNNMPRLDVQHDFVLTIEENGSFKVQQDEKDWYVVNRSKFAEPVLLAYKFVTLDITYQPITDKPVNKDNELETEDENPLNHGLTGTALMQAFAKVALRSASK